jgi:phospholipase/carboxylesterase
MKIKEASEPASICIIWMHGLGSDADNMRALAKELPITFPVRHVCLEAPVRPVTFNNHMPMRAWYDVTGFTLSDREDEEGIFRSVELIHAAIDAQLQLGFQEKQIFLAGFSQGGAMALIAGLCSSYALGGILSLSSYLPLSATLQATLPVSTPIFFGVGLHDQVVLPAWTSHAIAWLHAHGFERVQTHHYPMEHTVCFEEINEMASWLMIHTSSTMHHAGDLL